MTTGNDTPATANAPARRHVLAGAALALGGLSLANRTRAAAAENGDTPATHGRTFLHQDVYFAAPAHRIYDALLDDKQFAAFTGLPAKISRDVGGELWMFGGIILGRNIELVPDQRIVQAWRERSWDPGVYSLVKFEIEAQDKGTKVALDHTGFGEGNFWHLDPGWNIRYWNPMKKFFGEPG